VLRTYLATVFRIRKAGLTRASAVTGAVTLIQRFGSSLERLVQRIAQRIGCALEAWG
jgi:hypothetical protein